MRPLTLSDFFHPLSELYCCSAEEYTLMANFTHVITGIKDRLKALQEPDDPKNKKKPAR